ncbi:hypothetical protein ACQKWADRAFT_306962 [Trichoderma austrokoningii]
MIVVPIPEFICSTDEMTILQENELISMAGLPTTSWRGGRVSTACVACHRLKMKCIRTGDSPCARCQRARRDCCSRQPIVSDALEVVLKTPENFKSNKSRPSTYTRYGRGNGKGYNRKKLPVSRDEQILELGQVRENVDDLPSIYSTAPFRIVLEDDYVQHVLALELKSPEIALSTPPSTVQSSENPSCVLDAILSNTEMKQLIKIFCARLLPSIPIFTKDDLGDPEALIEEQPDLLHSICYVTSRYLPGGLSTVQAVYPLVLRFVQERSVDASWSEKANIGYFRALVVLYAFSEAAPSNLHSSHSLYMLPARLLKTVTEIYGTQLGLYRSIDDVRAILSLPRNELVSNLSYKRYTYWLWLFTMSHHSALITRTPPSIRSDYSIRAAPELFARINISSRLRRLLGEVELCLLWEKANTLDSGLGEWWCPFEVEIPKASRSSPSAIAAIVTHDLAAWRTKYSSFIEQGGFGTGLDFHYRFSQFCLSTYAVCHFAHASNNGERHLLTKATLGHAVEVLSWLQHLSPVAQESLRYISDFAFIMLLFTCTFILQACESHHMTLEEKQKKLKAVSTTAKLLVDLGIHAFHFPSIFGKSLQKRLDNFRLGGYDDEKVEILMETPCSEVPGMWTDYYSTAFRESPFLNETGDPEVLFGELLDIHNLNWYDILQ